MAYLRLDTLAYPVYEDAIRQAHPNTSFPAQFSPPDGYAQVQPSVQPAHDYLTQAVQEAAPVLSGGAYAQAWEVVALPAEQVAANIATARARTESAIKAERERLSDDGGYSVIVDGVVKWFHSDAKSKTQQLGLVIIGASVPPVPWKTMDGSFVGMTTALAGKIFQAAVAQDMAIFAAAEAHRLAVQSSTDPAGYDFSSGWPAVYAE